MGMSYDDVVDDLYNSYLDAQAAQGQLGLNWYYADDYFPADKTNALSHVIQGMYRTLEFMAAVLSLDDYGYPENNYGLITALDRSLANEFITEAPAADVTMSNILSAMVSADFTEFQTFIGFIDGYRVALWNEPFNAEYYAALARGFME